MNTKHKMMATIALMAMCSMAPMRQSLADPKLQPADVQAADVQAAPPQTIPFEPPVVHPGYNPHSKPLARAPQKRGNRFLDGQCGKARDLMFRDEDRKTFRAMHPFLLHEPKSYLVRKRP